jgi:GT2 family glycosyltransferase
VKLSVIIVSYNVKDYLRQCLDSLNKALEGIEADVYVVDNHSKDNTVAYLKKYYRHVNYISCNHNLGFARANNIAIRQSEGEYVLLLNPDTIVGENVLRKAVNFMDSHPGAGGAGVRMLKTDGTPAMESRRGLPTPMTSLYKMCGLCERYSKSRRFGKYYMSYLGWDEPAQIEVISGAFCLLRRTALNKTGLLDEDFFMYGEDIDLSYRLLKAGYENWYLPVSILHYKGESTQKSSFRYVHVFYEAMLIFFRKHYSSFSFWISVPIKIAIMFKAFTALVSMLLKKMYMSLGFFIDRKSDETRYLFICKRQNRDDCRRLAFKNGLDASFADGDEHSLPEGHKDMACDISEENICVVYDTDAYSYESILRLMHNYSNSHVRLGTYSNKAHAIITEKEVLK